MLDAVTEGSLRFWNGGAALSATLQGCYMSPPAETGKARPGDERNVRDLFCPRLVSLEQVEADIRGG